MKKFMEAIDTLKSWVGCYESLEDKKTFVSVLNDVRDWAPKWAPASEFGARKPKRKYKRKKK